jgi:hypothetical protein
MKSYVSILTIAQARFRPLGFDKSKYGIAELLQNYRWVLFAKKAPWIVTSQRREREQKASDNAVQTLQ